MQNVSECLYWCYACFVLWTCRFMLLADYESYIRCQEKASETYAVSLMFICRVYLLWIVHQLPTPDMLLGDFNTNHPMLSCSCQILSGNLIEQILLSHPLVLLDHITHTPYVRRCGLQLSSVVCRSVRSVCHTESCKNGWTDRDAVWVEDSGGAREPCIRLGSRSTPCKGTILRGKGRPLVKSRATLPTPVRKQLNQSWCRLDCRLGLAQGTTK